MATKNVYHRRLVAESAAKSCWICFKPSSTVMITPDSDDYFYVCAGHLTDRKFAIAKDGEDVAEQKRKEELEKEIEAVKKEFAEKMRKKLARRKQKEHEKPDDSKAKDEKIDATEDDADAKDEAEKLKQLEAKKDPVKAKVEGPRVFELQKNFYQMRVQKKRDMEVAKRAKERLRAPGAFPSVPAGGL